MLTGGCCAPGPKAYYGPTLPLAAVVADINANNRQIRSLWAAQSFSANITDDKHQSHYASGDGPLLYLKPSDLLIKGSGIGGDLFEIGCNKDEYWLTVWPGTPTQWWGRIHNLGRPCTRLPPVAMRPDLVREVLALSDLDPDLSHEPLPVMRFNNQQDAYMIVWHLPTNDRWIAQREVWYDRATLLPRLVLLYDENGRVLLRAELGEHMAVPGTQAKVATSYKLLFPDSQSTLEFQLSQVQTQYRNAPRPGLIRRRGGADLKVNQLDEDCGD